MTAAEVVDLVSEKGPAEVAASTMCISLLRTSSSSSLGGGGGDANDFHGSGRRRLGGSGALGGGVQMEAVQIAGPAGMFQEWRVGCFLFFFRFLCSYLLSLGLGLRLGQMYGLVARVWLLCVVVCVSVARVSSVWVTWHKISA